MSNTTRLQSWTLKHKKARRWKTGAAGKNTIPLWEASVQIPSDRDSATTLPWMRDLLLSMKRDATYESDLSWDEMHDLLCRLIATGGGSDLPPSVRRAAEFALAVLPPPSDSSYLSYVSYFENCKDLSTYFAVALYELANLLPARFVTKTANELKTQVFQECSKPHSNRPLYQLRVFALGVLMHQKVPGALGVLQRRVRTLAATREPSKSWWAAHGDWALLYRQAMIDNACAAGPASTQELEIFLREQFGEGYELRIQN